MSEPVDDERNFFKTFFKRDVDVQELTRYLRLDPTQALRLPIFFFNCAYTLTQTEESVDYQLEHR
ncbi:hypothetical protein E2C01_062401 [Portunus trituberculatus]|uniref:Uncharacterized protein n=1 Tax=Portunus trituberculatus TaxID=210409 RepID=A0A5B7HHX4_PORTR|nr:hypothetical protein [Portunus trituberculatus]